MKFNTLPFLLAVVSTIGTTAEADYADSLLRIPVPCINTRNANGHIICPDGEDYYEYNDLKALEAKFEKKHQLEPAFEYMLAIKKREAEEEAAQEQTAREQEEKKAAYLAEIKKVVKTNEVVIFSKNGCPWCTKAKNLLNEHGVEPTVVNCNFKDADYKSELFALTDLNTWPQIFIRGTFVGGYTALKDLEPYFNKILPPCNGCIGESKNEKESTDKSEEKAHASIQGNAEAPATTAQHVGQGRTQLPTEQSHIPPTSMPTSAATTTPAETLTTPSTTSAAILSKRNPLTPPHWLVNLGHTIAQPFHVASEKFDTYVASPIKNHIYEPIHNHVYEPIHSLFSPPSIEVAPFTTGAPPIDIASINSGASSYVTAPENPIINLIPGVPVPVLDSGINNAGRPFLGDFKDLGPSRLELDWNLPAPVDIPATIPAPVVTQNKDKGKGREQTFAATNARAHPKFEVGGPSNYQQENIPPPTIGGGPWIGDAFQRFNGPKPKPFEVPAKPAAVAESSKQGAAKPFMLPELNLPGEKVHWTEAELQSVWGVSPKENLLQTSETPEIMWDKKDTKVKPDARIREDEWTGSMMDRPRGRKIWA